MLRTTLLVLTRLAAAGLITALAVRLTGFDYWYPMTQLIAFTPYCVPAGVVIVAAFLVQRRWFAAVLTGLATIAVSLLVLPRLVPDSPAVADGVAIRVMSVNLRIGGADAADIAALAKRAEVDVIAFQEFTPDTGTRLDQADMTRFPFRSIHPRGLALGSAIYSRLPIRDDGVRRHASGFYQARGTLSVPGIGDVRIESAHPCAPTGAARSRCWTDDLADQPSAADGTPQILLGDFNATLDHAALRKLLAGGYTDAAASVGKGLTPTWPFDRPVPRIAIDHVLFSPAIAAKTFTTYPVRGTDHRCIIADLTIRAS